MDNIKIQKVYDNDGLIELKLIAYSELICATQMCYIQDVSLLSNASIIKNYSQKNASVYVEFGYKKGNYTPAFSLDLAKRDMRGHVKIEVDIEIADNDERRHRCLFYVESDLGSIERFGIALSNLVNAEIDTEIELHN